MNRVEFANYGLLILLCLHAFLFRPGSVVRACTHAGSDALNGGAVRREAVRLKLTAFHCTAGADGMEWALGQVIDVLGDLICAVCFDQDNY